MTEMDKNKGESMSRRQFEAQIIAKAWKDPEYKKRLLKSPKEVIQEELRIIRPGLTLPDNLQVYIHEETPNAVHMTLPVNPADYGEVSGDEWIDSVDGGVLGKTVVTAVNVFMIGNVNTLGNTNVMGNVNVEINTNIAGNVNVEANVNMV